MTLEEGYTFAAVSILSKSGDRTYPVLADHTRIVESALPATIRNPSNATAYISPV